MTAALSQNGELNLPAELRARLRPRAADDFEIEGEDDVTITLGRIPAGPNRGLIDHVFKLPRPFAAV
jgi:hypothetical protein